MMTQTEEKKILLYLTALGFVNTNISALGLKVSSKTNTKYSFNSEDVMNSIRKAEQAWKNISFANRIEWNFTSIERTNLLNLINEAIAQIITSIESMNKIQCEGQEQILRFLSDSMQKLDYLKRTI